MKNPDPEYWERSLRSFGQGLSKTEKSIITGKLAQVAAIRRGSAKGSGSEKLYELSDSVYQSVLEVADKQIRIRILQELGWNQYRRSPESPENADKAISFYGKAQSSSGSGTSPMLLALTALAHLRARRIQEALPIALEAWNALPASVRELATSDARAIPIEPCDPWLAGVDPLSVSFVLRRIAGALNGYVSDPGTLSTSISIKLRHCWQTDKCEQRLLQHARRLAETALALSKANGERREQIQAENFLGLICCKLGDGIAAVGAHTTSRHVAEQFTWYPELAQATRNLGLAYEASGKLDDAVETLEASERHFENADRPNKKNEVVTTLWHKGRIRIKSGNPAGIDDIGKHLDGIKGTNMDNWHWRANDHCLLGIAYWDILADRSAAAATFESMVKDYKPDDVAVNFAAQAYGVDNALANLISAWERVSGDPSISHTRLASDLALLMRHIERLRQAELSMIQSLGLV
jgi:tetratricopeptide (TPR) repeat protein